ncbi:2OG-Fe(II) oxygenase [Kordiimonas sp.]|uniref:2OG-Fe(II) oxygenase family protein n=1 Tax=Kordiimonas sp. TaxID=1970157 RepID=UPI003A8F648C
MTQRRTIGWGEAAPMFKALSPFNPSFDFSSVAGRYIALVFFGSSRNPRSSEVLGKIAAGPAKKGALYFGVTNHKEDFDADIVKKAFPHGHIFCDENWDIAKQYGLVSKREEDGATVFKPCWFLLDPTLRVYAAGELERIDRLAKVIAGLPPADHHATHVEPWAPVLVVPRVLSTQFCKQLIQHYVDGEPGESGFMRVKDGRTVPVFDHSFKRRMDIKIQDEALKTELRVSLQRRLVPQIKKAFQFEATRIERYIVACYDSESQGFFKAHRDDTTPGTAHRRFAVTINLNADDYEGGGLRFPEYGSRVYKAPTGGAIVFSCSLLHEATPVTAGTRYATLPFLYGEQDAAIREAGKSTIESISSVAPEKIA